MSQAKLELFHHMLSADPLSDSPKLIFLHGVMGFGANWRRIAKAFEHEYQTLAYDQRGHGRSFQPLSGYAPKNYAEDLRDIMDELSWEKATVVGHSMGGRNALEFAALFPERLDRLVIEDIGPRMNPRAAGFLLELLDSVPVPFSSKRAARAWFDSEFLRLWASRPDAKGLAEFLYANLAEAPGGATQWRFSVSGVRASVAQGRAQDRWAQIEALKGPVLLVRGERSEDLSRAMFDEILLRNPRIEGIEIAGAGHWVHSDRPDEFIAALSGFFLRHPV